MREEKIVAQCPPEHLAETERAFCERLRRLKAEVDSCASVAVELCRVDLFDEIDAAAESLEWAINKMGGSR